jgi:hypothetical protein
VETKVSGLVMLSKRGILKIENVLSHTACFAVCERTSLV